MANKTDTSSIFRIVAVLTALSLVGACALVILQTSGGSTSSEMAALSQSMSQGAAAALNGTGGGFTEFDASVKRLAQLQRVAGPAVGGSSSDWRELESHAAAILAKRSDVEALNSAAAVITASSAAMLGLSNELLSRSSATAVIQEFQQRADRIGRNSQGLASNNDAVAAATGIADDAAFIRNVANALGGDASDLDVRALNDEGREVALVPLLGHLAELEAQVEKIIASAPEIAGLGDSQAAMAATSRRLMETAFSGASSAGPLSGYLGIVWIPVGLLGFAVVLVIILVALNGRSAVFERTANEQAAQNDRNQQAILRLLDEMGSLADGDLTVEATVSEDITGTIADSFNFAIEELRKLVTTVNETAIMVDSAAKQTENSAAHMAKAAENQTSEINAATESIV